MDSLDREQSNMKTRTMALYQKTRCHPSGFELRRGSVAFKGVLNGLKAIVFDGPVFLGAGYRKGGGYGG